MISDLRTRSLDVASVANLRALLGSSSGSSCSTSSSSSSGGGGLLRSGSLQVGGSCGAPTTAAGLPPVWRSRSFQAGSRHAPSPTTHASSWTHSRDTKQLLACTHSEHGGDERSAIYAMLLAEIECLLQDRHQLVARHARLRQENEQLAEVVGRLSCMLEQQRGGCARLQHLVVADHGQPGAAAARRWSSSSSSRSRAAADGQPSPQRAGGWRVPPPLQPSQQQHQHQQHQQHQQQQRLQRQCSAPLPLLARHACQEMQAAPPGRPWHMLQPHACPDQQQQLLLLRKYSLDPSMLQPQRRRQPPAPLRSRLQPVSSSDSSCSSSSSNSDGSNISDSATFSPDDL